MRIRPLAWAFLLAGCGAALTPGGAAAQGSALVTALTECRRLEDSAARLACYDAAAGRLQTASSSGEIIVVDRAQAQAARRQSFGFNLPSLEIFRPATGGGDDGDRLSVTAAQVTQTGNGWVFRTADGQTWRQTDNRMLAPRPKAGSKLEIRRAAMGSYLMNIDGQRAIRVRREQ